MPPIAEIIVTDIFGTNISKGTYGIAIPWADSMEGDDTSSCACTIQRADRIVQNAYRIIDDDLQTGWRAKGKISNACANCLCTTEPWIQLYFSRKLCVSGITIIAKGFNSLDLNDTTTNMNDWSVDIQDDEDDTIGRLPIRSDEADIDTNRSLILWHWTKISRSVFRSYYDLGNSTNGGYTARKGRFFYAKDPEDTLSNETNTTILTAPPNSPSFYSMIVTISTENWLTILVGVGIVIVVVFMGYISLKWFCCCRRKELPKGKNEGKDISNLNSSVTTIVLTNPLHDDLGGHPKHKRLNSLHFLPNTQTMELLKTVTKNNNGTMNRKGIINDGGGTTNGRVSFPALAVQGDTNVQHRDHQRENRILTVVEDNNDNYTSNWVGQKDEVVYHNPLLSRKDTTNAKIGREQTVGKTEHRQYKNDSDDANDPYRLMHTCRWEAKLNDNTTVLNYCSVSFVNKYTGKEVFYVLDEYADTITRAYHILEEQKKSKEAVTIWQIVPSDELNVSLDNNGLPPLQPYYYENQDTGESTWIKPDSLRATDELRFTNEYIRVYLEATNWEKVEEEGEAIYWYNHKTQESSWDTPMCLNTVDRLTKVETERRIREEAADWVIIHEGTKRKYECLRTGEKQRSRPVILLAVDTANRERVYEEALRIDEWFVDVDNDSGKMYWWDGSMEQNRDTTWEKPNCSREGWNTAVDRLCITENEKEYMEWPEEYDNPMEVYDIGEVETLQQEIAEKIRRAMMTIMVKDGMRDE